MFIVLKDVWLRDSISIACGNCQGIAAKAKEEIGGEDSYALVEIYMTNSRSKHGSHMQVGAVPDED